jgi:hypothetical protein
VAPHHSAQVQQVPQFAMSQLFVHFLIGLSRNVQTAFQVGHCCIGPGTDRLAKCSNVTISIKISKITTSRHAPRFPLQSVHPPASGDDILFFFKKGSIECQYKAAWRSRLVNANRPSGENRSARLLRISGPYQRNIHMTLSDCEPC